MIVHTKRPGAIRMLTLCGVATTTLLFAGCTAGDPANESFERSDYFTRGIGQYPGDPAEDFSPSLAPDPSTYRNIARLRTAYHSSSYDYNLTAQLTTDGIVCHDEPRYINLTTPQGEAPKREREWTIDGGPYSRYVTQGENAFLQYTLNQWNESADRLHFKGRVAYKEEEAKEGYAFICEGSNDGKSWTCLGKTGGKGLPGKASKYRMHSDPNKVTSEETLPVRILDEEFRFEQKGDYSYYRVRFQMRGAAYWTLMDVDFYNGEKPVDLLPSKFFNSAWMSATSGEEWIYVDLGSRSTFDAVKLHLINKAVKGKVQVSDDSRNWKEVASLPGGTEKTDEISLNGEAKARYVRILMEQSENDKRYILSEIEVMGKGGLVASPAATGRYKGLRR